MIIKAAGGGGGRGMRVVHTEAALVSAVNMTRTEAASAFGNPMVHMEKFLENPRHVEIQVLAGQFQERRLSGRARLLDATTAPEGDRGGAGTAYRPAIARIGERCADACRRINYRGAGTFEFLYENGEFYFIEMNTRVQVEHPVTERSPASTSSRNRSGSPPARSCVSGRRTSPSRATPSSAASTPRILSRSCLLPARSASGTRPAARHPVDSHVYAGYTVPPHYDSMIGRLIAYGDTREQAIRRMRIAPRR